MTGEEHIFKGQVIVENKGFDGLMLSVSGELSQDSIAAMLNVKPEVIALRLAWLKESAPAEYVKAVNELGALLKLYKEFTIEKGKQDGSH